MWFKVEPCTPRIGMICTASGGDASKSNGHEVFTKFSRFRFEMCQLDDLDELQRWGRTGSIVRTTAVDNRKSRGHCYSSAGYVVLTSFTLIGVHKLQGPAYCSDLGRLRERVV